ncbi:MAG: METTL5 family protein [Candidatus Kariarchaeaceae archaeon]
MSPFGSPKIEYEQYQTPPRVAANLLHRAYMQGNIEEKNIVDLCAGTGILGLGAAILGGRVDLVEREDDAFRQLAENAKKVDIPVTLHQENVITWESKRQYDTAILNPPFGIQQKKVRDLDFVKKAGEIAEVIYTIHDGSPSNQEKLPGLYNELGLTIKEMYLDEFPLSSSYPWHKMRRRIHKVLVVYSS